MGARRASFRKISGVSILTPPRDLLNLVLSTVNLVLKLAKFSRHAYECTKSQKSLAAARGHAWACIYIRVYARCTKFNSNLVDHCIHIPSTIDSRRLSILRPPLIK